MELTKVLEALARIEEGLKQPKSDAYESPETKDIAAALAKAQGEFPIIGPNRENPYFKSVYTDLDTIIRAIRPALTKNGLALTQQTQINDQGTTILHTRIRHASGQWIESRVRIVPLKNDPQTYGSTLSYQRRYSVMSLLGLTCTQDVQDDDAEVAQTPARDVVERGTSPSLKYNPREETVDTITKEQLEELHYELAEYPDLAEMVLEKMHIQTLADLPKSKFLSSITRIREIKNARNGVK